MGRGALLIVDDEEDILTALASRFRARGFDVITAADGDEVASLFERHLPDVVLLDLGMPRLDGLAALRELRELSPQTCVIVMSGQSLQAAHAAAVGQEAADLLPKPLDLAVLDRAVQAGMLRPKV